jgi:hypothetical protein
MDGTNVASAMLVVLGSVLTVLGLFGGGNIPVMAMGLISIFAAGLLGLLATRRAGRG